MEFVDAIREGDGSRILRCWRYLLLLFKATQKHHSSYNNAVTVPLFI